MRRVNTTQARQDMTRLLDAAGQQPIIIRYHQRDTAVLLSIREYRRLQALEQAAETTPAQESQHDD